MDDRARSLYTRYWSAHPRFNFIERLPAGARVLDLGAGGGRAARWTLSAASGRGRLDLHWTGVDRKPRPRTSQHEVWLVADLCVDPLPLSAEAFDAVFLSHVLEHLRDTSPLRREARRLLRPRGLLYVETPASASLHADHARVLDDRGYRVMRGRFDEDTSHVRPYDPADLREFVARAGCAPLESGEVWNDALAEEMLVLGRELDDAQMTTYGHWLASRWSAYAVGRRTEPPGPLPEDDLAI